MTLVIPSTEVHGREAVSPSRRGDGGFFALLMNLLHGQGRKPEAPDSSVASKR